MVEEVAYLLLIDGIGTALTTSESVDDAYVATLGFDTAYPGLATPTGLECSLELRKGVLDGSSASFTIADLDDTLPQLFGASLDDAEPLLVKVDAGTSALGSALYDKHIGTEKIGSSGERRRHSCVPGWNVGMAHLSEAQAAVTNLAASPVSDVPVVWEGRRCCLYRLARSPGDDWPDLTDEAERLAARVWFGTLLGSGEQYAKVWQIRCAGPESWIMGTLGAGVSQVGYPVEVNVQLDEDAGEHAIVGWLDIVSLFDETDSADVYAGQTTNTALLSGAETYEDVAAAVHAFLDVLQDDVSEGTALSATGLSGLRYSTEPGDDGVQLRWDREAYGVIADRYCLRLQLLAHEKVWKILGYDPKVQNSSVDPVATPDKYGQFELSPLDVDYPAHWLGTFWTATPYAMGKKESGGTSEGLPEHTNAYGGWRRWPPIYAGGANCFDFSATNQTFRLRHFDPVFLAASSAVPLPADPDDPTSVLTIPDVGAATHQGMVAFSGPYRDETDPEADVSKITVVARVAWRENADGSVATDGLYPKLAIYEWPEPKLYGLEDPRPTIWGAWRTPPDDGEPHVMRSLMVLEQGGGSDVVGYVLARLFASTGAAGGWYTDATLTTPAYGLGGSAYLDVGPNDLGLTGVGDEKLGRFSDANGSTFALAVPAEMIAAGADEQAAFETALERMAEGDLFRCKTVLGKVVSSLDVVRSLLSPIGWSVSLAGGQFGIFDPFKFEAPLADTGVVTSESLAGTPGEPDSVRPTQELRKYAAIDRVKLEARLNPITGQHARTEELRSPDPGVMYRAQSLEHAVAGSHLIHPSILNMKGADWLPGWLERWRTVCRWWSARHFECSLTLPASRHAEFWPGSIVSITSEWLVSPAGAVYGIVQAPGYVVSRTFDAINATVEVTAIVNAKSLRLYATGAKVTRYVENEGGVGYRLLCEDDYLGIRGNTGTFDVEGFAEPPWSDAGGDADVEVLGFDGSTWTGGIYGVVDSINAEAGNCYIQLKGALTGATWMRDRHHIVVLRNAAEQTAPWPFAVHGAIGNKAGNYTGATKTAKFTE